MSHRTAHHISRSLNPKSGEKSPRFQSLTPVLTAFAVLTLVACSEPTVPEADVGSSPELSVQQDWTDRAGGVFWNGCTGEYVGFAEGSAEHELLKLQDDGAGGFHGRYHANGRNYNGPGLEWTGSEFVPTGTQYQGNSVYNETLNIRPPFPWEGTITSDTRVIQKGSGDNMRFHTVDHITVNANGEWTADVLDGWFTCG